MCDDTAVDIGDRVPDKVMLYRAVIRRGFLSEDKTRVTELAFEKAGKNHTDGLSFATSVKAAIKKFPKNKGVIWILAGAMHGLGRDLACHYDAKDKDHVILRNLPCIDKTPEEKDLANAVAGELAPKAEIESANHVPLVEES